MNLLASLINGDVDERIHTTMARYGRGTFKGPAVNSSVSGRRLVTSGSYLYLPVLAQLLVEISSENLAVRGVIISNADIEGEIEGHGLAVVDVKKRGGFKFKVEGEIPPSGFHEIHEELWESAVLLRAKAPKMRLSTGQSVPKPKKANDPGFCKLTVPATEENGARVATALLPGIEAGSFETLIVSHTIRVDELVIPEELSGKPASVVRKGAKRRGVLSREVTIDGEKTESDFEFLA